MTRDHEANHAVVMMHVRDELRRARRAFVIACTIATAASILAAWGWLR